MWIAREKEEEEEVKIDVSMHSLRSRGKRGRNLPFLLLDSFFPHLLLFAAVHDVTGTVHVHSREVM